MENIFADAVASTTTDSQPTTDTNVSTSNSTPVLGDEYNLDFNDLYDEGESQESPSNITSNQETNNVATNESSIDNNPTNQAFAQMRNQNKEYSDKMNEIDAIVKAAGLRDIDDFIAQSKAAQIKKQAETQGLPEEVVRELNEMRDFRARIEQKEAQEAVRAKEYALAQTVNEFIVQNKLTQDSVNSLSDSLAKDGLTTDRLMDLPKSALNKILSAYTGASVQKVLAQKEAIRNELPINQSSQVSQDTLNKSIDDIARLLAGKN
jgi:hypothetical protein